VTTIDVLQGAVGGEMDSAVSAADGGHDRGRRSGTYSSPPQDVADQYQGDPDRQQQQQHAEHHGLIVRALQGGASGSGMVTGRDDR